MAGFLFILKPEQEQMSLNDFRITFGDVFNATN